ncbi:MAG TPA: hypothetical protein VLN90_05075 [Thioalkalivibrio sp.]|nr:hypothetical protein [Thioalkalivibrio sp.]
MNLFLVGCASLDVERAPGRSVDTAQSFYVEKLPADGRGIEQVIADQLNLMGYSARSGTPGQNGNGADVLVTYQDRWYWDITMYMRQLDVQFRDPLTLEAWVSGSSRRDSLTRKAPPGMAREVLEEMVK